jgi:hypothetical protein
MTKAEKKYNSANPDPQNTSQILVCLALVLPLAAYLWKGFIMRYSGDEYFYGIDQNKQGFISHTGLIKTSKVSFPISCIPTNAQ